jgi:gamma-glutamylcyclotransferase (GGCT)/AIG2-like uncharacterized protein YtfP
LAEKIDRYISLLTKLETRAWQSPDFHDLRFRRDILLFVYDNLKRDTLENNKYLEGAKYLGKAMTVNTNLKMMSAGTDYPVVFDEKVMIHACIKGEAFLVSPQHILAIDELQQNNLYFNRRIEKIVLLDQMNSPALESVGHTYLKHKWAHGFMYIGDKDAFSATKLSNRGTRQSRVMVSPITGRPYYEWDIWESDFPGAVNENIENTSEREKEIRDFWGMPGQAGWSMYDHYD